MVFPTPLPTHCSRRREKPLFPMYFCRRLHGASGKMVFPT
uniref:Uncharacterized protein n=1 Tax=Cucumis melo TaxID=3656 RepID=A0A9I9E2R0_CUCME